MGGGYPANIRLFRFMELPDPATVANRLTMPHGSLRFQPATVSDWPSLVVATCDASDGKPYRAALVLEKALLQCHRGKQETRSAGHRALAEPEQSVVLVPPETVAASLMMRGGWPNEEAFEGTLRFFQGDGVPDLMPENEANTFFVIYGPGELRTALQRLEQRTAALLGEVKHTDDNNEDEQRAVTIRAILRFLCHAVWDDQQLVAIFSDPS